VACQVIEFMNGMSMGSEYVRSEWDFLNRRKCPSSEHGAVVRSFGLQACHHYLLELVESLAPKDPTTSPTTSSPSEIHPHQSPRSEQSKCIVVVRLLLQSYSLTTDDFPVQTARLITSITFEAGPTAFLPPPHLAQ